MAISIRRVERRIVRRLWLAVGALAAVDLALSLVVAAEAFDPSPADVAPPAAAAASMPFSTRNDAPLPPSLSAYRAVIERPLFARNRRPFGRKPADQIAIGSAGAFALAGIVAAGARRIALIRHGVPPRTESLMEGAEIDGWAVRTIGDDRVVLRNATTDHTILLYKDASQPAGR
jgi:hypothetical protein